MEDQLDLLNESLDVCWAGTQASAKVEETRLDPCICVFLAILQ